jgi:23S rRNA (uracil1939-C5)-methyltransferase
MDEFVVVPDGWLSRGQAFVRGSGVQLVVSGGIPGEEVRVRVTGRTTHQVFARAIGPEKNPHPSRVAPVCDRYNPCGRCPWMHMNPEGIASAQKSMLAEAFRDAAIPVVPLDGPITDASGVHTIELVAGFSDEKHIRIGVSGADGRDVVPIPRCHVVTEPIREAMKVLAHHIRELMIYPYDGANGILKRIRIIQAPASNELLITLVTAKRNYLLGQLAQAVGAAMPEVGSIYAFQDQADPPEEPFLLYGKDLVEGSVLLPVPTRVRCGPIDFFPGHPLLAAKAATDAVRLLEVTSEDAVVELGTGAAFRSLALAKQAGWVLGIDPSPMAILRARENASLNQLNAEFQVATVTEAMENPRIAGLRPLVCIDTERKGLEAPDLEALLAAAPRKLFLSCANPRALAKDIAAIVRRGYLLKRISAYDVAPFTPFTENTALLVSPDQRRPQRRAPRRKTVRT